MDHSFIIVAKKVSPNPRSPKFSPIRSSRIFIVFHFTFRSVTYCDSIIMKGIKSVSRLILWHVDAQFFQYHLLKTPMCCL